MSDFSRRTKQGDSLFAFECPRCHRQDSLVRVSIEETVWHGVVVAMHGLKSSPRVQIDGTKEAKFSTGRRTLRVDCTRCGYTDQPAFFVTGDLG